MQSLALPFCRVTLRSDPPSTSLYLVYNHNKEVEIAPTYLKVSSAIIPFPFKDQERLSVESNQKKVMDIDLQSLVFEKNLAEQSFLFKDPFTAQSLKVFLYFELQVDGKCQTEYRLDISATSLPLKKNCLSCNPSAPLVFYEICNKEGQSLYESEISKMTTQDPFWNPSELLKKGDLFPCFAVKIYQSLDQKKTKRLQIGSVNIDFELLMNDKEFMFEIQGSGGKSYIIIERIQEIIDHKFDSPSLM